MEKVLEKVVCGHQLVGLQVVRWEEVKNAWKLEIERGWMKCLSGKELKKLI